MVLPVGCASVSEGEGIAGSIGAINSDYKPEINDSKDTAIASKL